MRAPNGGVKLAVAPSTLRPSDRVGNPAQVVGATRALQPHPPRVDRLAGFAPPSVDHAPSGGRRAASRGRHVGELEGAMCYPSANGVARFRGQCDRVDARVRPGSSVGPATRSDLRDIRANHAANA